MSCLETIFVLVHVFSVAVWCIRICHMLTYSGETYKKYINKLVILQKKAIRCMSKAKYNEHSSPLFKRSKIIKFKDIHNSQLCQIVYDFVNYNVPPPLMDIYTRNSEIHHHDTRHNIDIHLPKVNFEIVRRSFLYKGPDLWMDQIGSFHQIFKHKKRHLK